MTTYDSTYEAVRAAVAEAMDRTDDNKRPLRAPTRDEVRALRAARIGVNDTGTRPTPAPVSGDSIGATADLKDKGVLGWSWSDTPGGTG